MTHTSAHFVAAPSPTGAPVNRLFVMLPGTGAVPRFYRQIVRTGAEEGHHAIGLTYPNDTAVGDLCRTSSDPDCAGKVRREILTGEDLSPLVAINRDASIVGRLEDLVRYLSQTYPAEGWGQLLLAGQLNWSRITVAGHSQGAGHAAYLGKMRSLDRIVMFSGPSDLGPGNASLARWPSLPNLTPASRQYGFTHVADDLTPLALVDTNWTLLGMAAFGPTASVDGATPPYGGSRRLVTGAPPNPDPGGPTPSPTHASPVVDAFTPRDAEGRPAYRPVWVHLAFP
ncbi:MAG TPA: hypothetical protein VGN74_00345 [Brevundimonas sp.]|jgi:hypothetical protein|uniref:BPSS1187 family protein n=1 Tax=Brevundimonas sp. TaxID=1871086 RepID=UPI002E0D3EE6|nr:hypothetical protein [Brevundimonas sp.]